MLIFVQFQSELCFHAAKGLFSVINKFNLFNTKTAPTFSHQFLISRNKHETAPKKGEKKLIHVRPGVPKMATDSITYTNGTHVDT